VALFTSSSGNGVKAMAKFKSFMKKSDIIGEIRFQDPLTNKPEQAKIQVTEWAKELVSKI